MEKESKSKNLIIILLILIILILSGALVYKEYFMKNEDNVEINDKTDHKNENVETTLTDQAIIDVIDNNISVLLNGKGFYGVDYLGSGVIFNTISKVGVENISDYYKLISVASKYENYNDDGSLVIAKDIVESNIKKVYGDNFNYVQLINEESCPLYLKYEADNYYFMGNCASAGDSKTEYYIYNKTILDDEVYVYASVKYLEMTEQGGIWYKNLEKEVATDQEDAINELNYNEYSKFKITFSKNTEGNYVFKSSERISK